MDDSDLDLFVGYLLKRLLYSLGGAADVCLDDDVEFLYALGDLRKQVVEVCTAVRLEGVLLCLCAAAVGKLTRHSFVFDCVELIARGGKIGKTDYLNGH